LLCLRLTVIKVIMHISKPDQEMVRFDEVWQEFDMSGILSKLDLLLLLRFGLSRRLLAFKIFNVVYSHWQLHSPLLFALFRFLFFHIEDLHEVFSVN
jgi:hypothetical protein